MAYFSCLSLDQDFSLAGQRTDIEEVLPLDHNLVRLNDFLGSVKDRQIQHFPKTDISIDAILLFSLQFISYLNINVYQF